MLESDVRFFQEKEVNGWNQSVIFQFDFFAKRITIETIAQRKEKVTECTQIVHPLFRGCAKIGDKLI